MAARFWVGGAGTWSSSNTANWSATTGGAGGASVPGSADTVAFDTNSGTGTVTTNYSPTVGALTVNNTNINLTLGANLTCSGTTTLTIGTLSLGSYTLTTNLFSSSNANTRSIAFGTGNITLTGNAATIWTTTTITNLTTSGSCTVNCTYSGSTGTRTVDTGVMTSANYLDFNISAGSDTFLYTSQRGFRNLNFTGFSGTLANTGNLNINIYGNLIFSSTMNFGVITSATSFNFVSPSPITQTITSNGLSIPASMLFSSAGTTFAINGNLTLASNATTTLTQGTLDLTNGGTGNYTLTTGLFSSSNANTRSIAFGTGNITITGNAASIWAVNTATNLTFTGTPTVNFTYAGATGNRVINNGGLAGGAQGNAINLIATSGTDTLSFAGTFINVNLTGFTGLLGATDKTIYGNWTNGIAPFSFPDSANTTSFVATSGTQTITSNGITIGGSITQTGAGKTVQLQDALTLNSGRTYTLTSGTLDLNSKTLTCGIFSSTNSNTRSIAFGTGNITLTGSGTTIWTTATSTNLTIAGTPTVNCTYSGSTGQRSFTNGGTVGSSAIAVNVNVSAGSDIFSLAAVSANYINNINFTGFSGSLISNTANFYGNIILSSAMTMPPFGAVGFGFNAPVGTTKTITSNNNTFNNNLVFSGTGTYQLVDNMNVNSGNFVSLTSGTLDLNSKTLTTGLFSSSNSNVRAINLGTNGKITVNGGDWTATTSTNLSLTGTGTIDMTYGTAKNFNGGSSVYPYTLNQGGAGTLTISGSNTFNTISNTVQPATITFTAGTTQTVTNFNVNGTAGNLVTINSTTAGTQANLSSPSNITNTVSYVSLQDNNATGGTWQAPSNQGNVIVSNVTGWFTGTLVTGAVVEDSQPADVSTTQTNFNSTITEDSQPADTSSVQTNFNSTIIETSNPADVSTTQTNFNSAITENLTPADVSTTQTNFNSAITENSSPADISSVYKSLYSAITENLNPASVQSVQASFNSAVTENFNPQDIISTQAIFSATVTENGYISDISVGYGWFRVNDLQNPNWTTINNSQP